MKFFRRLLGAIIIIAALIGMAASAGLVYVSNIVVESINEQANGIAGLVSDNLNTTAEALESVKGTVIEVNDSVSTLSNTASSLSDSVSSTEPLFDQVKQVTTEDVPSSIETVQETIPNLVSVAGTIDDTLTALSGFGFNQKFFGREIDLDLGIDYDPTQRFDQSMQDLGDSLDGLPESMRSLSEDLDTTYSSLEAVSLNIETLSTDLAEINTQVETIPPILDSYLESVTGINTQLNGIIDNLGVQLEQAKIVILMVAIWFGMLQLAPLVIGAQLLFAQRTNESDRIAAGVRAEFAKIEEERELSSDHTLEMP